MALLRAPRALLAMDPITVSRVSKVVDAEGNFAALREPLFTARGTLSNATTSEILLAARRGSRVDEILSVALDVDIRAGYFVTARGVTYEVVQVDDRRLFRRAIMRRDS